MDKVIQAARELGKAIQADERYIRAMASQQANDEDASLQKLISDFNTKRSELAGEVQKPDKNKTKISALDTEVKALYAEIFQNENMRAFSEARGDIQHVLDFVNQIITGSSSGLDPDSIEFQESCGGSCSSCSGCG